MGREFQHNFLNSVKRRIQPYWKMLMALELANPCCRAEVSESAWQGANDLMVRAGFNADRRRHTINQLKQQRRQASRWSMAEIRHCNTNLLAFYRDRCSGEMVESSFSHADDYVRLVFSILIASATIETYFSKNKYIKSRNRMSMKEKTTSNVLHLSQTPTPTDPEELSADPVYLDVCAAASRVENDIDELKEKYLNKMVTRSFVINDTTVVVRGIINRVVWEKSLMKFLFHVLYSDGDEEDLYHFEVKSYLNFV